MYCSLAGVKVIWLFASRVLVTSSTVTARPETEFRLPLKASLIVKVTGVSPIVSDTSVSNWVGAGTVAWASWNSLDVTVSVFSAVVCLRYSTPVPPLHTMVPVWVSKVTLSEYEAQLEVVSLTTPGTATVSAVGC